MASRQRNHHFIATAWILFLHQIACLSPFVDSFSTQRVTLSEATTRCRSRRLDGCVDTPQLLSLTPHAARHHGGISATLFSSASSTTESDETAAPPSASADEPINADDDKLDMPWSDVQEWALQDNLAKFTVIVPPPVAGGAARRYAMWRTLTREVPELAGYPVPFLRQMHQRSMKTADSSSSARQQKQETPGVLPMVDDFEFASDGGVAGRAYGLPGVADGTRIQTPSLVAAETTVPMGYVTTRGDDDGVGFSYELGTCASSSSVYSAGGTERSAALAAARRMVLDGAADSTKVAASVAKDVVATGSGLLSDTEANSDMVYLGGATAMLLASATAVGMLSHHLTVNVFWV